MQKKIFVLKGRASSGKTQTIKEIYKLLKIQYPEAEIEIFINKTDIKVIFIIYGIKIGIESQGDPNSRLKNSLKEFATKGCSIIICASRTRGMTNTWIEEYAKEFKITWIEKKISRDMSSEQMLLDNKIQALEILEQLFD